MSVALFNQKGAVGKAHLRHPSGSAMADMLRDLLASANLRANATIAHNLLERSAMAGNEQSRAAQTLYPAFISPVTLPH
jgi:hypothetical protein